MLNETPSAETAPKSTTKASTAGKKAAPKKKTKASAKVLPYAAGLKEIQVEILAKAMANFEKEAEAQSKGSKFGKIQVADVITFLAFNMGQGPTIDKKKDEKKTAALVIPAAALAQLEEAATRNGVTVDRIIEELGLSLKS